MSAFEDYCIVCEKQCAANSVYCSDECRHLDEDSSVSPALTACSADSASDYFASPLLTPNFGPVSYMAVPNPEGKPHPITVLSYESPLLASQTYGVLDLDQNQLDLNSTGRLSIDAAIDASAQTLVAPGANVSDILDGCASENYKKWLQAH